MQNVLINANEKRIDEIILDDSRSELLALQNEVCELKKVNASLGKRLDILRRWALSNIHLRNEMMNKA